MMAKNGKKKEGNGSAPQEERVANILNDNA